MQKPAECLAATRSHGEAVHACSRSVPGRSLTFALCVLGLVLGGTSGCSRPFWRLNADANTYGIITEKTTDPRWTFPRIDVQPDVRSRFFDPYDPDAEPLPPDDPTAHAYMHWVYGMRGYKGWHNNGDLISVENPQWLEPFGLSPTGIIEEENGNPPPGIQDLTLAQAIELSYIHSRDFQLQLENLYVTALALTFDRFRFNIRYLGFGGPPSSTTAYQVTPGVQQSVTSNNRFGVSQLLPTGAQWIVELSNNTLWLFSGGNKTSTASLLSFSLVQPLLQGAGRKVNLEALTQSERNVLYATRNFARFRQQFFVSTVAGGGTTSTNVGTSAGAQATTTVTTAAGTTVTAGGTPGTTGITAAGGYLGLLQNRQQTENTYNNIQAFEDQLARLRALAYNPEGVVSQNLLNLPGGLALPNVDGDLPEGAAPLPAILAGRIRYDSDAGRLLWRGDMTIEHQQALLALSAAPEYQAAVRELFNLATQSQTLTLTITQLATQLYNNRTQYLTNSKNLQDNIDRYKIQLGLPTDFPVTLDVQMLKPFQLIDARLMRLQKQITSFVSVWARLDEMQVDRNLLREVVAEFRKLEALIQKEGLDLVAEDFRRLQENWITRMEGLTDAAERQRVAVDVKRDRSVYDSIVADFQEARALISRFSTEVQSAELSDKDVLEMVRSLGELRETYLKIAQGLSVVQIGIRVELINLNPFDMTLEQATLQGLANRVDLMNQRAIVMDARRKVEVAANTLQAVLNLEVDGDISTKSIGMLNDRPFDFRGAQSSFRTGVSFTAPLDQVQKRNAYRASLIVYQQARRNYMAFEDQVKFDIRTAWRQINLSRQTFENTRRGVRLSALQYDTAVEQSTAPLGVGQTQGSSASGLNLIQALGNVLNNQNNLIQIWVNYEQSRLNIYRDMGIMELNENGVWTDDYYLRLQNSADAPPVSQSAPHADILPPQALLRPQELIDETLDENQAELLREALRENRASDDLDVGVARAVDRGRLGEGERQALVRR